MSEGSFTITQLVPNSVNVTNMFYVSNEQDYVSDSWHQSLDGALVVTQLNTSGLGGADQHGAALKSEGVANAIARVAGSNYYRPNLSNLKIDLSGGAWNYWEGWWLLGKRSYYSEKVGSYATLKVSGEHRYVRLRTQKHIGRGVLNVSVNGLQGKITGLAQSQYQDVDFLFDIGISNSSREFKVTLEGGGSIQINSIIPPPFYPTNDNGIPIIPVSLSSSGGGGNSSPNLIVNDESADFHKYGPINIGNTARTASIPFSTSPSRHSAKG